MNTKPINNINTIVTANRNFLYIYPPSNYIHFGKSGIRPNMYRFDDEYQENVAREMYDGLNQNRSIYDQKRINGYEYFTPQVDPALIVDLSKLSDKYMFMLKLEHRQVPQSYKLYGGNPPFGDCVSVIYYGYFTEEPVSYSNACNPRAKLIITHITEMKNYDYHNADGGASNYKTLKDESVIAYNNLRDMVSPVVPDNNGYGRHTPYMYYLDPYNAIAYNNACGNSYDGNYTQLNTDLRDTAYISNSLNMTKTPIHHKDRYNTANDHLKWITQNVKRAVAQDMCSGDSDMIYGTSIDDQLSMTFQTNSIHRTGSNNNYFLSTSSPPSLVDIVRDYNPEIIRYNYDRDESNGMPIVDTTTSSALNVHYSMVSTTLAALMNSAGIVGLSFVYDSQKAKDPLEANSDFPGVTLMGVNPFTPMTHAIQYGCVLNIIRELITGPFPIIENTVGEFTLNVNADLLSTTVLQLQPYGQLMVNDVFTFRNSLSGLISPNIGTEQTIMQNNTQLSELFNTMIGSNTDDYNPMKGNQTNVTRSLPPQRLIQSSNDYDTNPPVDNSENNVFSKIGKVF